jgi:quinoprotein glucose dehydrogenase
MRFPPVLLIALFITLLPAQDRQPPSQGYTGWSAYGGGNFDHIRYSRLAQIHRGNVARLKPAWRYDTGDAFKESEMQCNPIVVDGVMYVTSPKLRVIALDAATGRELWAFNPSPETPVRSKMRNRGVMYWTNGKISRVYFSFRNWLYALDAKTGKPAPDFGRAGRIDLRDGLGRPAGDLSITVTTPGVVWKDKLILGSLVSEGLPAAPGHIRAFDARTGKQRWIFRTIPNPGEFGYDTWPKDAWRYIGGANSWSGMALDAKRGLVFVPTGSAAFDFYGANRAGDNLFANCLLALKADTGARVWHFQFVRHDVWDRDLPAPPSLVTVRRDGRLIDAVAQLTKSGHVFVFDRETGKSLFPLQEIDVPVDGVDGEVLSPKQVLPLAPPPFARQQVTEGILTNRSPEARAASLERFRQVRSGPQFTPPSLEGTIIFPGFDGGAEWGGGTFDPETGLYYVNSNEMAWILRLVPRAAAATRTTGGRLYRRNCASCHGANLEGSASGFPALKEIGARRSETAVSSVIAKGAGRMPGFAHLGAAAVEALTRFLVANENKEVVIDDKAAVLPIDLKYDHDGYNKFLDPDGYPAVAPPWGTLTAIHLDNGEFAWRIPFGEFPELVAQGLRNTGSENYGGGVVTAGGLLFIGATNADNKFRAFDKLTGDLLWETTLDAAGNATPAVYEVKGRQYVVIGAGGGKWRGHSGGAYYAFALPEEEIRSEPGNAGTPARPR